MRVAELRQLFNAIDPSPFHERDLDPSAVEFIVGWSKELPKDAPLGLLVHLERAAGMADEAGLLRDAIHEFFVRRAEASRRDLRALLRRGRISLAIGLAVLGLATGVGDVLAIYFQESRLAAILHDSLIIGGWVAMWGPMEIFLYAWWPIRADSRLFDRLSAMPVRISYGANSALDAWRSDWPAVPACEPTSAERAPRPFAPTDPSA